MSLSTWWCVMSERRGKYNARRTERDGYVFHSLREANRYSELKLLEYAGEITNLELQQPVFKCVVNGQLICKYIADFRYKLPSGHEVVEDAKGYRTPEYRIKAKLVRALFSVVIVEV